MKVGFVSITSADGLNRTAIFILYQHLASYRMINHSKAKINYRWRGGL